jgi:transposase-like protein
MGGKQHESAEALWRDRLARFRKSRLSVAEFCQQEGISNPSFYQWRKRLGGDAARSKQVRAPAKTAQSPLVPVKVSSSVWVEIEFPNGIRMRVPAGNAEALRCAILAGKELLEATRC